MKNKLALFGGKPVRDAPLRPAYPYFSEKEFENVRKVLESGNIAEGEYVKKLEESFSKFAGTKYCVATSTGTAALHVSLLSLGIKKGDKVITTPYTFIATSNACLYVGAEPVFVDVDKKTFCIDPEEIKKHITPDVKAIIVVHIWGHPCDMDRIMKIAKDNNLYVIEDCSHAHGSEFNGKIVGSIGDIGCFSLYATKTITSGMGGLVTTNSKELADKIRLLKRVGDGGKYDHLVVGYNYKMSDIHASIGLAQVEKIDEFIKTREKNATYLTGLLGEFVDYIELPYIAKGAKHSFYYYPILLKEKVLKKVSREEFDKILRAENVTPTNCYPKPLHLQKAYEFLGGKKGDFPIAEDISSRTITLPVHPALGKSDMNDIYNAIKKIIEYIKS